MTSAELIGCSLREVPPGEAAYPYRYHDGDEELVIVIPGRPTLRTAEGNRELDQGEAVHFPLGEDGAHQIINRSQETVAFLAISSHGRPDIVVYQDSNKLGVGERLPRGGGLRAFFDRDLAVDYRDREQPPANSGPTRSGGCTTVATSSAWRSRCAHVRLIPRLRPWISPSP